MLSDQDALIVKETTKNVTDEQRPRIIAIHRKQLAANEKRQSELERELRGIERAQAMRYAALEALGASDG